ncbi:MAG: ferrous iron transport protein A [Chloracidobacterium sp. CP2_5A]|nr:MAG: ferrous iron transport protein A [Chloracidobacterium sp. CP2_5A]
MTLDALEIGATGQVERVRGGRAIAQRLQEMGVTKGVAVKVVRVAPLGDPLEVELRGYRLSLRKDEAAAIEISAL